MTYRDTSSNLIPVTVFRAAVRAVPPIPTLVLESLGVHLSWAPHSTTGTTWICAPIEQLLVVSVPPGRHTWCILNGAAACALGLACVCKLN